MRSRTAISASCRIVRYRPQFKPQAVQLQTHLWGPDTNLNARYLEWKYEQNPYVDEPNIYLALDGNEVIGMRGFYGARWQAGNRGESFTVLVADDHVVAPEHRNRGVVTRIMREALDDLAKRGHTCVFNLSGSQVTVFASLAMGWKSAGPVEPVGLRAKAALPGNDPFGHLDRAAHQNRKGTPISIERDPRPQAMSELVERLGHDGRIRHARDPQFFAWRFRDPLSEYRFLYAGESHLDGYLVLKRSIPATWKPYAVKISDMEAGDSSVRAALLDAAMESGRFDDLTAWNSTLHSDARRILGERGLEPLDLEDRARGFPCVLVKWLNSGIPAGDWRLGNQRLANLEDWNLRMLYTMAG